MGTEIISDVQKYRRKGNPRRNKHRQTQKRTCRTQGTFCGVICQTQVYHGTVGLEKVIEEDMEMYIAHNAIHGILRDNKITSKNPCKSKQRKWIRWERKHSNSLWHTDFKQMNDGNWFISYLDDASRYVVGCGAFKEATSKHAIQILEEAITRYGKPADILLTTDPSFMQTRPNAVRGESVFERKLAQLDIKHVLARIKHPQTNGK